MLMIAVLLVAVLIANLPTQSTFAGSHTIYRQRNSSGTVYGDEYFCQKCHPDEVANISGGSAHNSTACICHGYYPNYTKGYGPYGESYNYTINLKHNLTKDIYCTNCHTRYNTSTGAVQTGVNDTNEPILVANQSAHYIYLNSSNLTEIYDRAFFYLNRSFGPMAGP